MHHDFCFLMILTRNPPTVNPVMHHISSGSLASTATSPNTTSPTSPPATTPLGIYPEPPGCQPQMEMWQYTNQPDHWVCHTVMCACVHINDLLSLARWSQVLGPQGFPGDVNIWEKSRASNKANPVSRYLLYLSRFPHILVKFFCSHRLYTYLYVGNT